MHTDRDTGSSIEPRRDEEPLTDLTTVYLSYEQAVKEEGALLDSSQQPVC